MPEIKLNKRYKYAGDIMPKLLEIGFDIETAQDFLNSIEDADVVGVVRCKDCRYIETTEYGGFCCLKGECVAYLDYCNYGKRKEQNGV